MVCKCCGASIVGGKGDYWHTATGEMRCNNVSLSYAYPADECRHGRPECECAESFFMKKAKEYEVKMSENWCREGCCAGSGPVHQEASSIQKMVDPYRATESIVRATPPITTSLDYLAKAIEGLEMAIGELDARLQVVSSQEAHAVPMGISVHQDKPGTSDTAYRVGNYAETVNGLESRVQRMIRELEI